ncbi:MAG: putative DNA binding domain-containing protein [Candidatus Omnitrophica bacterium]|nr:putative DNA binding domain-containing protein [Candidatus Omnitrophota bacterium]
MPIQIIEITKEQKAKILSMDEGHFLDLKSKDIKPAKLTITISAFSNASGGELYIGIEDKSRIWRGFKSPEEANGHIQIFEKLFPLGQYYNYTFLSCPASEGLVLQVNVNKSRDITKASNGIPYVRRGAQNLPIDDEEKLKRLKFDKGIFSFESETLNIDKILVTNSEVIIKFLVDVVPTAEPEPWLKKQLLIIDDKPTVASSLLFAEEPQAILPKRSGIKIYRYKTTDDVGTRDALAFDPITVEGCIYDQIAESVKKTTDLIQDISTLGDAGLEKVIYPHEALHEIITNAVLHRDYSITSDIHVRIFDNRIEVESPGKLPGHITEKNILHEQFARNASLVRIINKFPNPPNKDVGEGLNTAFEAMRKLRLKEPTINETESSVVVSLKHERLASPEEAIMEYLSTHIEISNSIAREITYIDSENSVKRVFYRLRDNGLIERVPGRGGGASAWRKKV